MAGIEREVAVTSTQAALLRFHLCPDATPHARAPFTISKQLRVRPQMDTARLRRAVDTVVERHEVMRTRFILKDGAYGAYIEKTPAELLTIESASDETEARSRGAELAQAPIDVFAPMFQATLIRFGSEADIVVAKAHHLVVDGYSLGLIVEDIVKAYMGLPLPHVGMNVDRFIRDFDHVGKPGSFERRDAFLRRVFSDPLPPIPNLGRKAKGLRPNVDLVDCALGCEVIASIPRDQASALRARARAAGTTEVAMVVAAFARTIGEMGGVDDLIIQVPCALRHDRRLEDYVNFVASDVPVRVHLPSFDTLDALAASISKGIEEAIEFAPFMDSNYFGKIHDDVVARGSYTALFVAGSRTVDKWTRGTTTAPLQRPGATGELDLGIFKVTPLVDTRERWPVISEFDFRSFPMSGGLGFGLTYDGLGSDKVEAEQILQDIVLRLS